jgi:hypothetical protein
MTESEWLSCDFPFDMLRHLDGKIDDGEFIRFSVACCRRVWSLISDPRSRAIVEATEAYLAGNLTEALAGQVCADWLRAYEAGEVDDLAGGSTNEAIESVWGLGFGHAAQVASSCFEAAGYGASESQRVESIPQAQLTEVWRAAEFAERLEQCKILRELFGYRPERELPSERLSD